MPHFPHHRHRLSGESLEVSDERLALKNEPLCQPLRIPWQLESVLEGDSVRSNSQFCQVVQSHDPPAAPRGDIKPGMTCMQKWTVGNTYLWWGRLCLRTKICPQAPRCGRKSSLWQAKMFSMMLDMILPTLVDRKMKKRHACRKLCRCGAVPGCPALLSWRYSRRDGASSFQYISPPAAARKEVSPSFCMWTSSLISSLAFWYSKEVHFYGPSS
jgi:hypothetical protein